MEPQAAVIVANGGPHTGTAEQLVAEHLAHIHRVVLEPLEVQFAHALDSVGVVFNIFAQVDAEVGMMPIGVVALVHLSIPSLGTAARGIALEAQPHAVDDRRLALLDKGNRCHDILCGIGIGVIQAQQPVPLVEAHREVDFGQGVIVPHIVIAFLDTFGEITVDDIVDESRHIGNVHRVVKIDVGAMEHIIVGKAAQDDVNDLGEVTDVDAAVGIHISHTGLKKFRLRRFLIFVDAEAELRQVERERVVLVLSRELVGVVIVVLAGAVSPANSDLLAAARRGAVAVIGIENVPVAVLAVGKDKPHRAVDVGGQRVGAVALVGHLDATSGIPIAEGGVTHHIDGCLCRQDRQHKRHDCQ